jgi:hypothetical protein
MASEEDVVIVTIRNGTQHVQWTGIRAVGETTYNFQSNAVGWVPELPDVPSASFCVNQEQGPFEVNTCRLISPQWYIL